MTAPFDGGWGDIGGASRAFQNKSCDFAVSRTPALPCRGSTMLEILSSLRRAALGLTLLVASLAPAARLALAGDPPVEIAIANAGDQPLRCMIMFGHWITQDLGLVAPGGTAKVAMWRGQPPGALYIPRVDGRKMMIENVDCGGLAAWGETLGQVPLLPIRASAAARFAVACKLVERVSCAASGQGD
jgi:hypothetical protein